MYMYIFSYSEKSGQNSCGFYIFDKLETCPKFLKMRFLGMVLAKLIALGRNCSESIEQAILAKFRHRHLDDISHPFSIIF